MYLTITSFIYFCYSKLITHLSRVKKTSDFFFYLTHYLNVHTYMYVRSTLITLVIPNYLQNCIVIIIVFSHRRSYIIAISSKIHVTVHGQIKSSIITKCGWDVQITFNYKTGKLLIIVSSFFIDD